MTADELAKKLEVSRRLLFKLKAKYPNEAPPFNDIAGWRSFLDANKTTPNLPPERPSLAATPAAGTATASNLTYVDARARKTAIGAEMDLLKLEATKRNVIRREEVKVLFAKIGSVVRARLLKVRYDLPCSCVGLTESQIDKVVEEKFSYALAAFDIPKEFFEPQSVI